MRFFRSWESNHKKIIVFAIIRNAKPVIMRLRALHICFLSDLRLLCEESEMFQQYFHTDQNEHDATRDLCGLLPV